MVATIRLELVVVVVVDPEYPQGQVLHHLPEEPDPSALCQVEAVLRSLLVLPPGRHLVLGHGPGHHSLRVSDAAPGSATLRLEPGDMGLSVLYVEAVGDGVNLVDLVDVQVDVPGGRVRPIPLELGQFGWPHESAQPEGAGLVVRNNLVVPGMEGVHEGSDGFSLNII